MIFRKTEKILFEGIEILFMYLKFILSCLKVYSLILLNHLLRTYKLFCSTLIWSHWSFKLFMDSDTCKFSSFKDKIIERNHKVCKSL